MLWAEEAMAKVVGPRCQVRWACTNDKVAQETSTSGQFDDALGAFLTIMAKAVSKGLERVQGKLGGKGRGFQPPPPPLGCLSEGHTLARRQRRSHWTSPSGGPRPAGILHLGLYLQLVSLFLSSP